MIKPVDTFCQLNIENLSLSEPGAVATGQISTVKIEEN